MGIVAPIAGAYTGTWNSVALNYTRQGFSLNFTQKAERIEETDLYGLSLIDMVYRGATLSIDMIGKIYGAGTTGPLWPWTATFGVVYAAATPIARLATTVAQALVLTAVAGTPAAASPATLTAAKAIISPDNNMQVVFNSTLREVPLRWDVLLTESASVGSLFTTT